MSKQCRNVFRLAHTVTPPPAPSRSQLSMPSQPRLLAQPQPVPLPLIFTYSHTQRNRIIYPANLNLVASSLPNPSLGATFLLRYEFVKSCNRLLILLVSPLSILC